VDAGLAGCPRTADAVYWAVATRTAISLTDHTVINEHHRPLKPPLPLLLLFPLCLLTPSLASADAVPVTVGRVADIALHPELDAPAAVVSLNDSRISAELAARVLQVPVRVGDRVEQGDLLVQLDCADHELSERREQAAAKGLEARLGLARSQLERTRVLVEQKNVSQELLDQRRAELATLEAERDMQEVTLAAARRNVEKCRVHAPFDGVVLERLASVGELAGPGTPLLHLLDLGALEVSAQVQATQVPSLAGAVEIALVDQAQRYPLRLRTVAAALDPRMRSQEVRLELLGERAPPGTAGRIVWRNGAAHLPAELLVRRDGGLGVFVERDGVAHFHRIPDALEGQPARIELPADTRIVLAGRNRLQAGDRVSVQP
jgi:membrane fusion protein, multidrug efflux system